MAPAPATSVVPKTAAGAPTARSKESVDGLKVLVLCAGAGTSAMLANAIKEGAAATGENIASAAGAYGQHTGIMSQYDVIVLAPQVRSYYEDMKADTDRLGIKLLAPPTPAAVQIPIMENFSDFFSITIMKRLKTPPAKEQKKIMTTNKKTQ